MSIVQDQVKKVIKNVFVAEKENTLQLSEILFTDTIKAVVPLTEKKINWNEISTKEKREKFISEISLQKDEENKIDGEYLLLIPGGVDAHVHFNTPGFEFREDIEHGSYAAACGGNTTIIDMPCTSLPPVTCKENLYNKLEAVKKRSLIDYAFFGGVRGNDFETGLDIKKQIYQLADAGVAGFKAYLISGMETFTDLTKKEMLQVAKWIYETGKPLLVHSEDKNLVLSRQKKLQLKKRNDWKAYCESRDVKAETEAVKTMIDITRKTKCKIHIVHLSSKEALELVRTAKNDGLSISAETCPHYLYFTQKDFENDVIRNYLKTAPPIKSTEDRGALWQGLKDGTISFITTDHAGCNPNLEKSSNNFWEIYGGIPGVEHRVQFLFSEGFLKGKLTLQKTIELLSCNSADYFKLRQKGSITTGKDADFALINLWSSEKIEADKMLSKGKYTPFEGITFNALVGDVYLSGKRIIKNKNQCQSELLGKFIKYNN
jgi:allantoinase